MNETEGGPSAAITRTSAVYEQLRREIIQGTLLPGEKLRIEVLRTRYKVGGTPLREALNRLSTEGLVTQFEQRGFRVTPVSADDLLELTRLCHCNHYISSIAVGGEQDNDRTQGRKAARCRKISLGASATKMLARSRQRCAT